MNTEKRDVLVGTITTTARGLGFVSTDIYDEDVRIEAGFLNTALNGDVVEIALDPATGGQRTGRVIRIIERARTRFVGVVEDMKGTVAPDDRKFYVPFHAPSLTPGAHIHDKVFVELVRWDDPKKNPEVRVLEVLGAKGEHEVEMRAILLSRGIVSDFPKEVEDEAKQLKERATITDAEIAERRDMREVLTVTIDPASAKDFDDAISFREIINHKTQITNKAQKTNSNGDKLYEIGVHIADVSHYVTPGSALDREARERGYSTYLVDRTIPMLPEILSNDLCSLNPKEDKRAFSAIFTLTADGTITKRWFGRTLIHSNRRFTYEEAQGVLDGAEPNSAEADMLTALNTFAKKFRTERMREGAIDFEQDEVRFELDDDGKPIRIFTKERVDSHKLVEEWMLVANREVATFLKPKEGRPTGVLYRTHDSPDPEKIEQFKILLKALGYDLRPGKEKGVTGMMLNNLFEEIAGRPEEGLIKTVAVRSMAKANYSTKNIGHFGLAFQNYTHFTSPIRRYADLAVHRVLADKLAGRAQNQDAFALYTRLADELTSKEISVTGAQRDSVKYKQVEYMSAHVGETFTGIITGVSDFGMFVAEENTKAEGLIRLRTLSDDYYVLDRPHHRLVGQKKKRTFSLGDEVRMKVASADLDQKTLDYELA